LTSGDVAVLSYARISDDTERDGHGVTDQHRVNRRTAKRLGWRVVAELTDNDRSASKARVVRDAFEEMLVALRAGRLADGTVVHGVVLLNEDRLARRAGDYERFVEALTAEDGRVYADERGPKDLYAEDVEGMGLVGVAFAKIESRKAQRRMRRSHRARAEDGKPVGGTRPFGWQDDRRTLDPAEALHLAQAARDFAAGRALNSIVRGWQDAGVKTSLGNEWTMRSLKLALENPRICGWRRMGGELVTDEHGVPVVGQWEPIVDTETWLAVDATMRARKGRAVGSDGVAGALLPVDVREFRYLLSGILRCGKPKPDGGVCNAAMRVMDRRKNGRHIYQCVPRAHGGCSGVARHGPKTDEYVSEAVLAKLEERTARSTVATPWTGQAALDEVQQRLDELGRSWRSGVVTSELFFANVGPLEDERARLRNEQSRHAVSVQRRVTNVEDIRRRWYAGELDIPQKRVYIREALHAVVVLPAGRGRAPFNPDLLVPIWRE
jgi:DNA invertase Pin-like site-specific DNA recombinase